MRKRVFPKTPDEILDYGWDWTDWLDGDALQGSSWIVDGGITPSGQSNDAGSTLLWLTGGTLGTKYRVTNRITSAGAGRQNGLFG